MKTTVLMIKHFMTQFKYWPCQLLAIGADCSCICLYIQLNLINQPLTWGDQINPVQLSHYHGCWCPGSLCRQVISRHDIDYVEYVCRLTGGRIATTCVVSMWSNDIKCKYMFMFPLTNWPRKGLTGGLMLNKRMIYVPLDTSSLERWYICVNILMA